MSNEILHLLASGITQGLHAAEIRCVGLDQVGIELMLANNLAKAVANPRATVIPVPCRLRRELLRFSGGLRLSRDSEPISSTEQMPIP